MASKLNDSDLMPFGTHRGKPLGEIPDSYWKWFLDQKWCDIWPKLVEYANLCVSDDD